ncbi:MAG: hypothetical protein H6R05_1290 [Burkholderiaceae bacterium]|nr:hypothetical protein [Burkholderiaceae bacterium]
MANTPEQQSPVPTTSTTTPTNTDKKPSSGMGFKLSVAMLVILAGLGASSYLAYQRGMVNPYLPQMLQKNTADSVTLTPAQPAPAEPTPAVVNTSPAPANTNPATPVLTPPTAETTNSAAASTSPTPAAPVAPTVVPSNPSAPAVIMGSATTNALLAIMDAQTQWQAMQFDFNQRWDTANALQTIQTLKNQLQALNNSATLPAMSALSQTEAQIQAWHALNPQGNLAALQQAIIDVDKLQVRTVQEPAKEAAPTGMWARFIATLKNIFAIKRVNTAQDAALDAANAAIVKQGIVANLMSAQWAARNGQWQSAQIQLRTANTNIQSYGQGYTLDSLKPLMDASSFPAQPDFNTVQQALMQARAQLAAQAQSERTATPLKPNGAPL